MSEFKVIVGNIGTVYSGGCKKEAFAAFDEYWRQSEDGYGRAAHEDVALMQGDEILREFRFNKLKGAPPVKMLAHLIRNIKAEIRDEYVDEPGDTPHIDLTIGADHKDWSYQTGDNSYTGGAYGYRYWGIGTVTRRCNSITLAKEILDDLHGQLY